MGKCLNFSALLVVVLGLLAQQLWVRLDTVVERLLELEKTSDNPKLKALRIGYDMAGGKENGGASNIALAIKETLVYQVMGPPQTHARQAWRRLVHVLDQTGQNYLSPEHKIGFGPEGASETAEGFRMLTHLLKVGLEAYVEAEPTRPEMVKLLSTTLKLQGDNPDALYFMSLLQPQRFYRLHGKRTQEVYFSVTLHCNSKKEGTLTERVCADINSEAITFQPNGSFEVILGPEGQPQPACPACASKASFLAMPPSIVSVVTRHYFEAIPSANMNPELVHNVKVKLDVLGAEHELPLFLSDEEMASRLDGFTEFFAAHSIGMPQNDPTEAPLFFSLIPNVIGVPAKWTRENDGMGAVDIAYAAGPFSLQPGEALLMEGVIPADCTFANVVLWNRFLQTFDYRYRPVSLHRGQMALLAGGRYQIVLSAQHPDPNYGHDQHQPEFPINWLSTEGRSRGTIFWRYVLPQSPIRAASTRVLPLSDVLPYLRNSRKG